MLLPSLLLSVQVGYNGLERRQSGVRNRKSENKNKQKRWKER
jgi:hypothetical protein